MISVVVPVRNGMPWLEQQLRALAEQVCHEPWEVIVANNNSSDGSGVVAQEWAQPLRNDPSRRRLEGQGTRRHTKRRGRGGSRGPLGLL